MSAEEEKMAKKKLGRHRSPSKKPPQFWNLGHQPLKLELSAAWFLRGRKVIKRHETGRCGGAMV
jgi:hypothetical protein